MKFLKGTIDVRLTLEEVNTLNDLIARDTAKAVVHNEKYGGNYCPTCGTFAGKTDVFCEKCGQRLDHDNIAL